MFSRSNRRFLMFPARLKGKEANAALDDLAQKLLRSRFPEGIDRRYVLDAVDVQHPPRPRYELPPEEIRIRPALPKDAGGQIPDEPDRRQRREGSRTLLQSHRGAVRPLPQKFKECRGGVAGPDLSDVAKRYPEKTRDYLLESLVLPNAKIAPGFGQMTLNLDDGRVLTGAAARGRQNRSDAATARRQESDLPARYASRSRTEPQSPMPDGGPHTHTRGQMRDLIEFLSTLK